MRKLNLLFRTKGGHKEGMGDVTYSLALAEEFKRQGYDILFITNNNQNVIKLISESDFKYIIGETLFDLEKCVKERAIDIAVLIQLDTPEDEALVFRRHTQVLVTIDDRGKAASLADLRFNILYPDRNSYSDFKYIALSHRFREKHAFSKVIKKQVEKILVIQGGSDTYGFISKIVKALYDIAVDIDIEVIIGPNFSHYQELQKEIDAAPRNFNIIRDKSDLSDLMMQADLAITAAGLTLFELACLGVPAIVICAELFEIETAQRLEDEGFGVSLGFGEYVDENELYRLVKRLMNDFNLRSEMSRKGKELIDGYGTKKIVEKINEHFTVKNNVYNER